MRFPLKKLLPTVAAICILGLLYIGILKPLNYKEDFGTANNVTNLHLARFVLDLDSESNAAPCLCPATSFILSKSGGGGQL